MAAVANHTEWTPQQLEYIRFLAANKVAKDGTKWSRERFANEVAHCSPTTLYDWQKLPGFKLAVFEEALARRIEWIPQMLDAQIIKAVKGKDTNAFTAMLKAWELAKADTVIQEVHNIDDSLSE